MNNLRFSRGTALAALLFVFFFTGLRAQDTLIHYTETTGFDHNTRNESLGLFQQIANEHGLVIVSDNDGSRFNKTDLGQARAVIFSNTSGNQGLNADQQAALEWFVDTLGRHLIGIHAASDTYRHSSANGGSTGAWDWYAETLGGSVQTSPNHTSQNHVDTIYLIQPHPSVANIAFPWVKEEEYYYWENGYLNNDIETILEVGQTGSNSFDQQRPVAWFRTNAAGARIFYTSLGHKKSNFTGGFPAFEQLIEDAVLWLLDACQPTTSTLAASICDGESYLFDGNQLTEAGAYHVTFQNAAGCDSTVTLNLAVLTADTAVTQAGTTLTAGAADAAYQWLDCDNGLAPIAGATEASFTPVVNGNYAVQITTSAGCTGVSACYEVIITATEEATPRPFRLFPNPVQDRLMLDLAGATGSATIGLYTLQGRQLSQEIKPVAGPATVDVSGLPGGVYLLRIRIGGRSETLKFVKNQ